MDEALYSFMEKTLKDCVTSKLENKITTPCGEVYKTGFNDFDKVTGGFKPAELTIIAGRPAMGKTSFCLNCVQEIALHYGKSVGLFMA